LFEMSTLYAAKVVPTEKVKKPRTEKQIAAFEKAKATRAKKAQEKKDLEEQEMLNKQAEFEQAQIKLQELEEKKRIASEKRKATREAKRQLEELEEEQQEQVEESPKKKKKKQKVDNEEAKSETTLVGSTTPKEDDTVPPVWFKKYIEGMAQTQNQLEGTKKAQKVIREEAKAVADEKWAQPNVRQQVVKQVENHVDRLYAQIFGGRRMTRV